MGVKSAKELTVYQKAYQLSMDIFHVSKGFPPEERYALTGQIRRSSRSVCNNLREAWAKRRYPANFVSKLTDCDGENGKLILPWISRRIVATLPQNNTRPSRLNPWR
ncbi:MAG TPA: four helix bundle protein [Gemmataceae bacterium]|nr:four helix bundle protein [Gemmataceae bacterium]